MYPIKISLFSACTIGLCLVLGCAYVGSSTGTDRAVVQGGRAVIVVSPTVKAEIPVSAAIGDEVARAAADAAVQYLQGLGSPISQLNRAEAIRIGIDAAVKKSALNGRQPGEGERQEVESFVRQIAEKF